MAVNKKITDVIKARAKVLSDHKDKMSKAISSAKSKLSTAVSKVGPAPLTSAQKELAALKKGNKDLRNSINSAKKSAEKSANAFKAEAAKKVKAREAFDRKTNKDIEARKKARAKARAKAEKATRAKAKKARAIADQAPAKARKARLAKIAKLEKAVASSARKVKAKETLHGLKSAAKSKLSAFGSKVGSSARATSKATSTIAMSVRHAGEATTEKMALKFEKRMVEMAKAKNPKAQMKVFSKAMDEATTTLEKVNTNKKIAKIKSSNLSRSVKAAKIGKIKAQVKQAKALSKAGSALGRAKILSKDGVKGAKSAVKVLKALDVAKKVGKSGIAKALVKVGGPRGAMVVGAAVALSVAGAGLYAYFSSDDEKGTSGTPSNEVKKAAMKSLSETPIDSTTSEATSKAMGAATDKARVIAKSRPETKTELSKVLSDTRGVMRVMKESADKTGESIGKAVMSISDDAREMAGLGDSELAEAEMTLSDFDDKISAAADGMVESVSGAMDSFMEEGSEDSTEPTEEVAAKETPRGTSRRTPKSRVPKDRSVEPKAGTIRNGKIYVKGYRNSKNAKVKGHWRKLSKK